MEAEETIKQGQQAEDQKPQGFVKKQGYLNGTHKLTNASIDAILSERTTALAGSEDKILVNAVFGINKGQAEYIQLNVADKYGKEIAHVRFDTPEAGWKFAYIMSSDGNISYFFPAVAKVFRNDEFRAMCVNFARIFESYNENTK